MDSGYLERVPTGVGVKVAVLEFFTSPGGVTSVLAEVGPYLSQGTDRFIFIDPLPGGFRKEFGMPTLTLAVWPQWTVVTHPSRLVRLARQATVAVGYVVYACRLAIHLRRGNYTGLYVHLKKGILVGSLAARLARIPLYVHAHGFGSEREITGPFKWALGSARWLFTVSGDVRRILIASGLDARRIQVVHNGLDFQRWKRPQGTEPNVNRIIYVGAVQHVKGVHILLEAFAAMEEVSDRELLIVGDVPSGGDPTYLANLRARVNALGLEQQVRFLGRRSDVRELMASSRALVLPSLINESFGMVLVEAAAVGTLALGTDTGGIPEVLGNHELLVPVGDIAALTAKLEQLMDDGWYDQQLVRLQDHARQFNVREQAQQILRLISSKGEEA